MELLLSIIICYLIGTIPTSYLLVKFFGGKNIFESGSGNPGALNSYESTGKKGIGVAVLIFDVLKGIIAAVVAYQIAGGAHLPYLAGLIWVIIGNNYNIFFGGRGGRGLAVAAGAFGMVSPYIVITWLVMWAGGYYIIRKNVHIANGLALIGSMILVFSTPDAMYEITGILPVSDIFALKIAYSIACIVILMRHIKPLKELAAKSQDGEIEK
jgi:acyl phosphate:glycerol-3-phosphate acyltransferase